MAMRARGGRTNPSRPPRLLVGRVYEQFKPMSEWRQEDDHDTLLVYLPGFQKEYIKVTTEDVNIVRVRGERLVAENKWSRFQEDFRVPENCDMKGIRARFDGGILTVTMPRKTTATTTTTTTAAAPRVPPKAKAEEQPFRRTKQEEALPKPKLKESKKKETALESEKKPERRPSPVKAVTLPPQPMAPSSSSSRPTKQEPKKKETALESEKKPERSPSPVKAVTLPPQPMAPSSSSSRPTKQEPVKPVIEEWDQKKEELTFGSLPTIVPKKEKRDIVEKPIEEREIHHTGVAEKTNLDKGKGKEIQETSLEEAMKRVSEGIMGKSKDPGPSHGGFTSDHKVGEKKKVVTRREMNEDRKLLVNVGVGVLVIVAIGVHVSYAIGLLGRGK